MPEEYSIESTLEYESPNNKRDLQQARWSYHDTAKRIMDKINAEGRMATDKEGKDISRLIEKRDKADLAIKQFSDYEQRLNAPGGGSGNAGGGFSTGPFPSLGHQIRAIIAAGSPGGAADPKLFEVRASGLNEGMPSEGGFLLQQDFSANLLDRAYGASEVARRCSRFPISSGSNSIVLPAIDETDRRTSRFGGVVAYWIAEAGEKPPSKPKFRRIELTLKKLTALCYVSDELVEDVAALETYLTRMLTAEFGFRLDDVILNGLGAGQPLGILASPCLITVAKETGQAKETVVVENLVKMYSRMPGVNKANAVWLVNPEVTPQLYTMGITVGSGGSAIYMPAGGISGQPFNTLFGRPVIECEQCAALGTVGDLIFGDFSEYVIADKPLKTATSIHVRFVYYESVLRAVYRVDGCPVWNAPMTPFKGANDLSPFVTLAARP